MKVNELFKSELKVINMGLESFIRDMKSQDVSAFMSTGSLPPVERENGGASSRMKSI